MFSLRKPTLPQLKAFLESQKGAAYSYPEVGASKGEAPEGYRVEHHRVQLGSGEATYAKAIKALYDWRMYATKWTELYPADPPVTRGATLVVVAHHLGFWSSNACRIVYKLDEKHPLRRCGFALGTLPDHAEKGEERFVVEWNPQDDTVWFDIFAFSKQNQALAKAGFPLARQVQTRFSQDAQQAMQEAVK